MHDSFRQLIAQSREGKIHALQIATESSIRSMQEQSKKLVTGKLKEVAYQKIDEQTEALVSMIGDNQVDYRFFLGFKLMVTEEQLNLKNIKKSAWLTFTEFLHEVNHTLMNDFVSMPNDEINRYMKMEKLLENKISRRFKVRRLEINDFGYLMEHLYGRDGIAYEDYEYQLPKKKLQKETLIKYYDLIRPTRCVIEESQRYLRLEHEDKESYHKRIWRIFIMAKKITSATKLVIPCRISFANIFEPKSINGSEAKYSVSCLIPKDDKKTLLAIHKAVEAAKEDGKVRKWGGKLPPNLKLPLRDGDIDRPDDENYQEHFFLNATSKDAPQVVDRHVQPVVDPMMVYSGCFCNVSVNFYPFNANGNRGVAVGLGNIQFVKDGDRLSGRASADADFDALEDDEDVLGGDAGEELPDYLR